MVGARGCPYDCSFCGAAVSANPDITIRTRDPENIITEMDQLHARYDVTAFRFVDDLFLGYERFIRKCMAAFSVHESAAATYGTQPDASTSCTGPTTSYSTSWPTTGSGKWHSASNPAVNGS